MDILNFVDPLLILHFAFLSDWKETLTKTCFSLQFTSRLVEL